MTSSLCHNKETVTPLHLSALHSNTLNRMWNSPALTRQILKYPKGCTTLHMAFSMPVFICTAQNHSIFIGCLLQDDDQISFYRSGLRTDLYDIRPSMMYGLSPHPQQWTNYCLTVFDPLYSTFLTNASSRGPLF